MNNRIFKFNLSIDDQEKTFYIDPYSADRILFEEAGDSDVTLMIKNAFSEVSDIEQSYRKSYIKNILTPSRIALIVIARKMFDLKPIDRETGLGVTDTEVFDIFGQYIIWKEEIKKNIEKPPNI